MNEIKFRAFYEKKFYYFTIGESWDNYTRGMYVIICFKGIQFEQYIGREDRNKQRIFANDLFMDVDGIIMYVGWDNHASAWAFWEFGTNQFIGHIGEYSIKTMEIIGNIHEGIKNE